MVVVMGTVRVDPDAIERLRPAMEAMMAASRAEDGCLTYAYALDLLEPGLVRVSELWTDRVSLDDPTTEASREAALAAQPPARTNAAPFQKNNLPDPFENRQTGRVRTPPPEDPAPIAGRPAKP